VLRPSVVVSLYGMNYTKLNDLDLCLEVVSGHVIDVRRHPYNIGRSCNPTTVYVSER